MPSLRSLGWSEFFEAGFEPYRRDGFAVGRVVLQYKGGYRVYTEAGELSAEIRGRVRYNAEGRHDFPAVGDWVVLELVAGETKAAIRAVLPRKSKFSRKTAGPVTEEHIVAANIDTAFLMQGLDGDFNPRRLERYLTLAWECGANPVVVLSKADLCDDVGARLKQIEAISPGVDLHAISSVTNSGIAGLGRYISEGKTIAFLGSSGVGKSTLINRLLGKEIQKVREVREKDDRGRHTTTRRELILLDSGGLLIDTPGMRELQLWDVGEGVSDVFADVESLTGECYFSDCKHDREPGCAVREALEDGSLDQGRFENFVKMQRELEFLESRQDERKRLSRKERDRRLNRAYSRMPKKRA